MTNKLFVGNISWGATEQDLVEAFSVAGTVESAKIITDKFSGRSKGFGFVEMGSDAEAAKAVEMVDGVEVDGRALKVTEALPPRQ